MNDKDELDMPLKYLTDCNRLGICYECKKRKGKWLCDYITGFSMDLYGKGVIKQSTCDYLLCDECTKKINNRDYCKRHYKDLKIEIGSKKL